MREIPKRKKTSFTIDPEVLDRFVVAVAHRHKRTHGGIMSEVVQGMMMKWSDEVLGEGEDDD